MMIGIISFILSSFSCSREEECIIISDFIYINNTNYVIKTPVGIIQPNSQILIHDEGDGPCDISEKNYVPPFISETIIRFDSNKCLTFKSIKVGVGEGPVGIANYKFKKISSVYYEFTYTFTEEEYNQAVDCK